jgi:hypothetical protein
MRPAKSFWKNAHDCRATCQWVCQRIMLETLAAMAWWVMRFWLVSASGRTTSSTAAMPSKVRQDSSHRRSGSLPVINETTRPMNTGTIESSRATRNPVTNRPMNSPLAWRAKCQ